MANTPGLSPAQLNYADSAQWKQIVYQALNDTRCGTPAFLVENMAANQTVTAQIAIQERVRVPAGQRWYDVPPIGNVPVQMPRGGGFSVTLPLKKGDEGFLVFSDTCFDDWWLNGQANAPPAQNPAPWPYPVPSGSQRQREVRRHYVHDCMFVPGVWSQPNVLPSYSTDSLQIRTDDGVTTVIDVSQAGVTLTGATVTAANGGAAQALMTNTFFQWYVANIQPFLVSKGYVGPPIPVTGNETTILKGQ